MSRVMKDMAPLREMEKTNVQRDRRIGEVKDYSMKHKVTIQWDINEDAIRDKMFKLSVDDNEVILDLEELLRYTRWV